MSLTSLQHNKAWRKKVSNTMKRIGNMPPSFKGKRHSKETLKKMSEIRLKNPSKGMTGKKHTKKTKEEMSKIRIGIVFLPETIKKMSLAKKGDRSPTWKGGIIFLPEYTAYHSRVRRVRKLNAGGHHTIEQWKEVKKSFNDSCAFCFRKEPEVKITEDHIHPLSKGGNDDIENIQPLCMACNRWKSAKII